MRFMCRSTRMPRLQRGYDLDDIEMDVLEVECRSTQHNYIDHIFVVGQMLVQVTDAIVRIVKLTPNETSYLTGYESRLAKASTAKFKHALSKCK